MEIIRIVSELQKFKTVSTEAGFFSTVKVTANTMLSFVLVLEQDKQAIDNVTVMAEIVKGIHRTRSKERAKFSGQGSKKALVKIY